MLGSTTTPQPRNHHATTQPRNHAATHHPPPPRHTATPPPGSLAGAVNAVQAVLPSFEVASFGKIVNIGTNLVYNPVVTYYDYTAAKAALVGLTRNLGPWGPWARKLVGCLALCSCVHTFAHDFTSLIPTHRHPTSTTNPPTNPTTTPSFGAWPVRCAREPGSWRPAREDGRERPDH